MSGLRPGEVDADPILRETDPVQRITGYHQSRWLIQAESWVHLCSRETAARVREHIPSKTSIPRLLRTREPATCEGLFHLQFLCLVLYTRLVDHDIAKRNKYIGGSWGTVMSRVFRNCWRRRVLKPTATRMNTPIMTLAAADRSYTHLPWLFDFHMFFLDHHPNEIAPQL